MENIFTHFSKNQSTHSSMQEKNSKEMNKQIINLKAFQRANTIK